MAVLSTHLKSKDAGQADYKATEPLCVHCGLLVPRSRRGGTQGAKFCCFGCRLAYELARPGSQASSGKNEADYSGASGHVANTLLLRLGFGLFLAMNIMVFSWAFYSSEWYNQGTGHHDLLAGLFAYLLLLLSTILIATLGVPLAADAVEQVFASISMATSGEQVRYRADTLLRWFRTAGRIRVDTNALICIGVGAAYLISAIHTVQGRGSLYYDTAAMILVLVTLGYFLESNAKRKAMGATQEMSIPPVIKVRVQRNGQEAFIKSDQIVVGDRVYTRAGEEFAVDAVVVEGVSHVNASHLTGESKPHAVEPGHMVLAGTINIDGPLWGLAHRVGDDRVINQTRRLLEEARMYQLPIKRLADRAASIFVPSVLVLAVCVVVWHTIHGQATRGLFDALSVLLISCPCALGLAAPLASWSALRRAAHHGVIINSAATIERLAALDRVYFDKTGTLTDGYLSLHQIVVADGVDPDQALQWAAALESTSIHPIARSLVKEAEKRGFQSQGVKAAKTLPGLGVQACVDDQEMMLGSARLADTTGFNADQFDKTHLSRQVAEGSEVDCTRIYLFNKDRVLARFELAEKLRSHAVGAVARLKQMGIQIEMLTGDQPASAKTIANVLDIPFKGSLLPADKLKQITDTREQGGYVAMVGDGINDGPVLAGVDVGFVMGSATDLAKQAGHVWLLNDQLECIPTTIAIARHCMSRVRLNLAWAFGYNLVGVTLATCGFLTPIVSAVAMIASSLMIVTTSRGAGRVKTPDDQAETTNIEYEDRREISPAKPRNPADQPIPVM